MRHAAWVAVLWWLVLGAVCARDTRQDVRDLLATETELCRAFEQGDAAALRRHLDPAFTLVDSQGTISDLARNVEEVAQREPRYEIFRNEEQQVRVYGDAAIVIGITRVKGSAGGQPFAADFRFTDTWIQRDGAWKLAASHASRLP